MPGERPPEPGDLAVVDTGTRWSPMIRAMQRLADHGRRTRWDHVVIASRYRDGELMIVEAQPGGAVERPWHYQHRPYQWSTGILPPCHEAGEAARGYVGVGYSYLDYQAIAMHAWHMPDLPVWPEHTMAGYQDFSDAASVGDLSHRLIHGPQPQRETRLVTLREFIESTGHMICSELGDRARLDAGSHLFTDGRWPGYVKPSDTGRLMGV